MKKLEDFKNDKFVKELSVEKSKKIKGGTGTRCTGTYEGGKYQQQDCADTGGPDVFIDN